MADPAANQPVAPNPTDKKICGVDPKLYGIAPELCCWIKQKDQMVVGLIGQGTSRSLTARWDAPLEQTNAGTAAGYDKVSAATQIISGWTSITTFSTTQVWNGNNPIKFNLVLQFFAWDNPFEQVMLPLQRLEEFASPQVQGWSPFNPTALFKPDTNVVGRIPIRIALNIGRKIIMPECVIESISVPVDKEKDAKGDLIRADVTLDVQTLTMINRSDIGKSWAYTDADWDKITSKSW